jgi:NADP-dependent 3-hydroxy acid dehydrogenase YdfG
MSLPALKKYHKESYPAIAATNPELSQSGKTVMVAGASSGIGFAIARGFIAAGSKHVIILGRRPEAIEAAAAKLGQGLESEESPLIQGRACDMSDMESTRSLWSALESEGVYVDTLVLNAAAWGNSTPILESELKNVWSDFETNVRGLLDMTQRFYKQTTGKGQKV